jgi:hypothetical protein
MRTTGEVHDPMVGWLTTGKLAIPDWLANVPTMPTAYSIAFLLELTSSLGLADQPAVGRGDGFACPR